MKRVAGLAAFGLVVLVLVWASPQLLAQDQTSGFVPAPNIGRETLPALPLVYGAYGFVWVALMGYVFLLWRRIGKVERELAEVTARLAAGRK